MTDFQAHLELLEQRITILERQVARLSTPEVQKPARQAGDVVQLACDDPGIIYARAYHVETDAAERKFCWVGNEGAIQIVLPVAPSRPLQCALLTFPHPQLPLERLRLIVNDVEVPTATQATGKGVVVISFDVAESHASQLELWLHDVPSVRPSELGEGDDDRLLALCFYGAIVTYL